MRQFKLSGGRNDHIPLFFICLLCFITVSFSKQSWAEMNSKTNQVAFDAHAVLPGNQQSEVSYYDLKVEPGAKQDLVLKLHNTSTNQIKVVVEANNAVTNQNGVIDYSQHGVKLIGGPTFEELISADQTVTLAPEEEREVKFQLTIPPEGFEGTILGGFYCYEDTTGQASPQTGFSIKNKFAYTIGVKLSCSTDRIQPHLALTKVTPGLENGYLTVFAQLENLEPVLLSKLDLHATVTKKGQTEVLKEVTKKISFAPRTHFRLPISWNNEPLKKGEYILTLHLKNAAGKKWRFRKTFEIKGADEKLNKKAVEVKALPDRSNWIYLVILLFLGIIIILIGYIYKLKHSRR